MLKRLLFKPDLQNKPKKKRLKKLLKLLKLLLPSQALGKY